PAAGRSPRRRGPHAGPGGSGKRIPEDVEASFENGSRPGTASPHSSGTAAFDDLDGDAFAADGAFGEDVLREEAAVDVAEEGAQDEAASDEDTLSDDAIDEDALEDEVGDGDSSEDSDASEDDGGLDALDESARGDAFLFDDDAFPAGAGRNGTSVSEDPGVAWRDSDGGDSPLGPYAGSDVLEPPTLLQPPNHHPRRPAPAGEFPRERHPAVPAGPPGLVYLIDGVGPVSGTGTLRAYYRQPSPPGARGAAVVPLAIDKQLPRRSRHPIDHRIASVLLRLPRQSANERHGRRHPHDRRGRRGHGNPRSRGSKGDPFTITVTEKAWRTMLPWLLESGRLYLMPAEGVEAAPVVLDDQTPLQFNLLIERIPKRGDYHLTSRFLREDKTLIYKSQVLLITEGEKGLLLRRSGKLSPVNFAGSVAWLRALRRGRFRHIPRRKVPSLLKIFERSTTLPPIHFPGTLKITRIDGLDPRPELKLESGSQEVTAEVTFRYGEDLVRAARPGNRFFSMKNRRLVVRNPQAEGAHAVNLLKQGFLYDPKTHTFSLSADRLAQAAPELFELGWTLHGKKMPFRPPTDMAVDVTTGPDYIDVAVTVHFGDQNVDLATLLDAMKQGNRMILLKQGAIGVLPGEWLEKNAAWMELGHLHDGKLRFRKTQSAVIDALVAEKIQSRLDEGFRAEKERLTTFDGIHECEPSPDFKGTLRGYQRFGLGWLLFLDKMSWGGCLADDMGLGKTVQALALLDLLKSQGRGGTSLIVAPKSLIFNWMREAKRFTPKLNVLSYTGFRRTSAYENLADYDIVLTTYGTLRRDAEKLADFRFLYLILDEAQAIKNAESQNAKAAFVLQGERRLVLSGTPVENHLGELWSLFDFINPGMLGTYGAFKKRFVPPPRSKGDDGADRTVDSGSLNFLRRTLRPFILRRKKEEVTPDLPPKFEDTILCEMEPEQKLVYQDVKERCRNSVLAQVKAKGLARSKLHILEALLRLRQAACHPSLISDQYASVPSGKMTALLSMLDQVEDEGHKVLIFSQFTSLLAIVRKELDQLGTVYEYLDGQTRDREARVDRFQNDTKCRVFLISLKAGGLGLNLTAADYVFILDPWWNPAVEAQAIDRAHRIGQDKKVFAYRFVSEGSIEERIADMQESKRKLADAIVAADEHLLRDLTKEDLESLFS
ncbi:MAG TPA: SNF2-related protein, partial [Planctomycetota bacterium]|nr:SNF2-related protein [Planctomycetota bacterium]